MGAGTATAAAGAVLVRGGDGTGIGGVERWAEATAPAGGEAKDA